MAKVLIVEDDHNLSSTIEDLLVFERHTVEIVDRGRDAEELLRVYPYDLIILDLMLPDMLGLEVLSNFRSAGGKTPVLILTGQGKTEEKERGLDGGADDYLTKPFEPRELTARVRALLRRPAQFSGKQLSVGGLVLVPAGLSVKRGSEHIQLRPREFAVLEFLMRHPNQIFSSEDLLDRVWKSDSECSEESVRVTIKRLRTKLGADSPIRTIHGAGYILDSN